MFDLEDLEKWRDEQKAGSIIEHVKQSFGVRGNQQHVGQPSPSTNHRGGRNGAIVEIRARDGEAELFVVDLLRMFLRRAELNQWTVDVLSRSESETDAGGLKEIICLVSGPDAYAELVYSEPRDARGIIHDSVTVTVLPEADERDVPIDDRDLDISTPRKGAGGQMIGRPSPAIQIRHIPTGMVVVVDGDGSWHTNKARAMTILRSRLLARRTEGA